MKINSRHTFKMCSIYIENNADIFIVYQFTIKKTFPIKKVFCMSQIHKKMT